MLFGLRNMLKDARLQRAIHEGSWGVKIHRRIIMDPSKRSHQADVIRCSNCTHTPGAVIKCGQLSLTLLQPIGDSN